MNPLRWLLYGRKVYQCSCGEQFKHEVDYQIHWRLAHEHDAKLALLTGGGAQQQNDDGSWTPAIPLPWYVRQRRKADW